MNDWLWSELGELFQDDDGTLPDVWIDYTSSAPVPIAYRLLASRSQRVVTQHPSIWSTKGDWERPLDSVPNPAELVVSGEADAFHVVFGGVAWKGVVIPDLGVSVFAQGLGLDYRKGPKWGPRELGAFFELLKELTLLEAGAQPGIDGNQETQSLFKNVWRRWLVEGAA